MDEIAILAAAIRTWFPAAQQLPAVDCDAIGADHQQPRLVQFQGKLAVVPEPLQIERVGRIGRGGGVWVRYLQRIGSGDLLQSPRWTCRHVAQLDDIRFSSEGRGSSPSMLVFSSILRPIQASNPWPGCRGINDKIPVPSSR